MSTEHTTVSECNNSFCNNTAAQHTSVVGAQTGAGWDHDLWAHIVKNWLTYWRFNLQTISPSLSFHPYSTAAFNADARRAACCYFSHWLISSAGLTGKRIKPRGKSLTARREPSGTSTDLWWAAYLIFHPLFSIFPQLCFGFTEFHQY